MHEPTWQVFKLNEPLNAVEHSGVTRKEFGTPSLSCAI